MTGAPATKGSGVSVADAAATSPAAAAAATRCFLVCSGLGHINRGYESFARECFDALRDHPSVRMTLYKGGGESSPDGREVSLWNTPRDFRSADLLGKLLMNKGCFFSEQVTFVLSLLPHIVRHRPEVIFVSEPPTARLLWQMRRATRQHYRILFSNGQPLTPELMTVPRFDHVHQLAPPHYNDAIRIGIPASRQSMVPMGILMSSAPFVPLPPDERAALRRRLDLPVDRPVVLSVALMNKSHKRIDYLIEEVHRLPEPRPFLLLLGQTDHETPEVLELAETRLGKENYSARTVALAEVEQYYRASDLFAFASLFEGFGRVLLEAQRFGLRCLVHDWELNRFVVGSQGRLADLSQPGALARLLTEELRGWSAERGATDPEAASAISRHVFEGFSWERLSPRYVEMIRACADQP